MNQMKNRSTARATGRGPGRPPTQSIEGAKNFFFLPDDCSIGQG